MSACNNVWMHACMHGTYTYIPKYVGMYVGWGAELLFTCFYLDMFLLPTLERVGDL